MTSLLVSYRNDGLAPSAPDGRYGLGVHGMARRRGGHRVIALAHGAEDVVLFGWSMGGAICLQTADLSRHRHLIRAMVLDAPVINWVNVLAHHAQLNRHPVAVGRYGQLMLSHPLGRRLTGLAAPVDLKAMDWVSPGRGAADADPDHPQRRRRVCAVRPVGQLADEEPGDGHVRDRSADARHTKEWNVDPERWEGLVDAWLRARLAPRRSGRARKGPGTRRPDEGPG